MKQEGTRECSDTRPRNCVVLGSGRCGTSLVAGTLAECSYNFGEDLLEPDDANPRGYFESRSINRINEDLLAQVVPLRPPRLGRLLFRDRLYRGQLWLAVPPQDWRPAGDPAVQRRMRECLPPEPWCIKDPRFAHTLDAWRPVVGDAVVVCAFRHPSETVASILENCRTARYLRTVRMTPEWAEAVWCSAYESALEISSRWGEWIFVEYPDLVAGRGLVRVCETLGVAAVDTFREPSLHRRGREVEVSGRALELYERLRELARIFGTTVPNRD